MQNTSVPPTFHSFTFSWPNDPNPQKMATYKELMGQSGQMGPSYAQMNQSPLDLDYLIHTLRHPTPDTSVQQVLGYIYNYIPYVKVEHNLRMIFASFLNSPVCFGENVPSYEDNYLIIEVFKLITDKKLKVSQPTLPIKTFYSVLLKELQNFVGFDPLRNSWKAMPIISGMWLSNQLRDQLYTENNVLEYKWFFHDWDEQSDALFKRSLQFSLSRSTPANISNLGLLSLALKFRTRENIDDYLGKIPRSVVISGLSDLVFGLNNSDGRKYQLFGQTGPNDPNWNIFIKENVLQKPVIKHLNRLSFLLESLLQDLSYSEQNFQLLMHLVSSMLEFNRELNHFTSTQRFLNMALEEISDENTFQAQYMLLLKGYLFFEVIVFQGVLSRFVSLKNVSLAYLLFRPKQHVSRIENEYRQIGRLILHSLYYLNFVLMTIGQGGFDGYNFVYYVCLEVCLQNNTQNAFEFFTQYLIGDYKEVNLYHGAINRNYVARCKVLFVLGLWENYLQMLKAKNAEFVEFMYRTAFDLARNPHIQDHLLVEATHSVLLVYFTNKENTSHDLEQVLNYFEILVDQFPRNLSANQLSVAVETLGKKIMSTPIVYTGNGLHKTSVDEFLEFVFFKCQNTRSGQRIEQASESVFTSAQPIQEIDAASTMSQLKKNKDLDQTDIVKHNKRKKPKDLPGMKLLPQNPRNPQENFTKREVPSTSREAIIVAFLNIIPYLPLNIFVRWLDKIWLLIWSSNEEERAYLTGKLWHVLSNNLDFNRCKLAYPWWYETKEAVEAELGHRQQLSKF